MRSGVTFYWHEKEKQGKVDNSDLKLFTEVHFFIGAEMQDQMHNITSKMVGGWANLAFCFWPIVISANCISLSSGIWSAVGSGCSAESADRRTRARPSSIAGMAAAAAAAANVIARRKTPPFLAPPEVRGFLAHWREGTVFLSFSLAWTKEFNVRTKRRVRESTLNGVKRKGF